MNYTTWNSRVLLVFLF